MWYPFFVVMVGVCGGGGEGGGGSVMSGYILVDLPEVKLLT